MQIDRSMLVPKRHQNRVQAVLSDAKTSKQQTKRQAQKKPPRADSSNFSAMAKRFIQAGTTKSTRRNFESDLRHLAVNGIYAESTPDAVLEYLAKFAGSHKVGTLERRRVSLGKAATRKNLPSPVKALPVLQALAGIRRTHGVRPRGVTPAVKETLLEMLIVGKQCQKKVAFARDISVLLLCFCGALRRSDRVLPDALSPQSVALIVKRAAARISANADDFSGHALRAGFCTEGSMAGLANWQIRAVSRHANDVHRSAYVRPLSNKTPNLL